jgi:ribose transport system permease protein
VYALGGNEEAARLAGVNVNRMKIAVSAICGFASGLTLLSRVFNGQVSTGAGIEFDALTAALPGGVSFKGGEGTILGLILGVLNNGMQLVGLQDFYQSLVKGAVLLAAVGFDVYQTSRKARETVQKVAA